MQGFKSFAIAILMAASSVLALGTAAAQDPLKVAPDMYKLIFENERVRVMEVVFAPGGKIAKHSHPDHFAYVLSGGMLRISKPDTVSSDANLKVGEVLWIPAETHWAENIGETEIRVLVTELKEPAPKVKAKAGAKAKAAAESK